MANLNGTTSLIKNIGSCQLNFTCDHEEADTKMFVYLEHIIREIPVQRAIIHSPDTDVAIISLYQLATSLKHLSLLWLKTGVGSNIRYNSIIQCLI